MRKKRVKLILMALTSSAALLSVGVSAQSVESSRGYQYPTHLSKGNFSIVKDVPRTARNQSHTDVTLDFNSLPFSEAIVRVKGDGSRRVAVIVDPTCPHSRTLEDNLEQIDNVTIYTFVSSILSGSERIVNAIHCSGNQAQKGAAYDAYSKYRIMPKAAACDSKSDQRIEQSIYGYKNIDKLTPTIIFESNVFFSTVMGVDEIEVMLEQSLTNKL